VLRALGLELEVLDPQAHGLENTANPALIIETSPVETKQRVAPV
jgi:hypothetical protein